MSLMIFMAIYNLTKQLIKSITCPAGKHKIDVYDSRCKGLLLEVRSTGGKTFYFRFRNDRGKVRQLRIGSHDWVSLSQARELTKIKKSKLAMGEDPCELKAEIKRIPMLGSFIRENYLPFIKTYKRSWKTDESIIKNHIQPNFGHLFMDEVTKKHVLDFIGRLSSTHAPGSVNQAIILLRYIYNCAIRWETVGVVKNPTKGIPLLEENNKRERFLSKDEVDRLVDAVRRSPNRMLKYIIPMLILTGARKREVLTARWEDFDLEKSIWRIPMTKSGKPRYVPISKTTEQLLKKVPRFEGTGFVFPNPQTLQPYVSFYHAWNTAREAAGLSDVRVHDLRHSFASFLVNAGRSLYEVQRILGHAQISTTQRYAHLSQESLLSAANTVSEAVRLEI